MSRPKTIHLTDESMRFVRRGESLSGRINQIIERYGEMLRSAGAPQLLSTSDDEQAILNAVNDLSLAPFDSYCERLAELLHKRGRLHQAACVLALDPVQLMALIEWAETELLLARWKSNSQSDELAAKAMNAWAQEVVERSAPSPTPILDALKAR